jgi:malyl-CoA/(S)-citramalyl-CoA lyase
MEKHMRNPRNVGRPLALGAPSPLIDIPVRPSRMIHFFDPSNPRMAVKVPDIARKVDIILANLEDAIEGDNKVAAREGSEPPSSGRA